jgi:hypothetical protein
MAKMTITSDEMFIEMNNDPRYDEPQARRAIAGGWAWWIWMVGYLWGLQA